jgi:hypothetical protein
MQSGYPVVLKFSLAVCTDVTGQTEISSTCSKKRDFAQILGTEGGQDLFRLCYVNGIPFFAIHQPHSFVLHPPHIQEYFISNNPNIKMVSVITLATMVLFAAVSLGAAEISSASAFSTVIGKENCVSVSWDMGDTLTTFTMASASTTDVGFKPKKHKPAFWPILAAEATSTTTSETAGTSSAAVENPFAGCGWKQWSFGEKLPSNCDDPNTKGFPFCVAGKPAT